jgi:hypothetical protein
MADGYFLTRDDPEWQAAWGQFADPTMRNEETGERLEYMGTALGEGGYVHCFRHRTVPGTNTRQDWGVCASPGWHPGMRQGH